MNTLGLPDGVKLIETSGDYAYAVTDVNQLHIIDVTPPEGAAIVSTYEIGADAFAMDVNEGYMYFADYTEVFRIVDIEPPESAIQISELETFYKGKGVTASGDYVYLANNYGGLVIVDVSSPASPVIAGRVLGVFGSPTVTSMNGFTYLLGALFGLQILDCNPPESASVILSMGDTQFVDGDISNGYAYLCEKNVLSIVDIDPPDESEIIYSIEINTPMDQLLYDNGHVFTVDWLSNINIIDVDPPGSAHLANEISLPEEFDIFAMHADSGYLFVARSLHFSNEYTLSIIDVDPVEEAQIIVEFEHYGEAWDIAVQDNYVFVAAENYGLQIFDISDILTPKVVEIGGYQGDARGVTVSNGYAFVTYFSSGSLQVIDCSPPQGAHWVAGIDIPIDGYGVAVSDGYAYIIGSGAPRIIKMW